MASTGKGFGIQKIELTGVEPGPQRAPHMEEDEFLPARMADEMRAAIDAHFSEPHRTCPKPTRSGIIGTFRTSTPTCGQCPRRSSPGRWSSDSIRSASWARETLGMGYVTWPYLSLYVDGCRQDLHNDFGGRFGYVYSLTWDERKTIGGETIVLYDGDLFRNNMTSSAAGWNLYEMIPPRFNRLVVFDDRMPHGVQRVEGAMDPLEGRSSCMAISARRDRSFRAPLLRTPSPIRSTPRSRIMRSRLRAGRSNITAPRSAHRCRRVGRGDVRHAVARSSRPARGGMTRDAANHIVAFAEKMDFPPRTGLPT